MVKHLAVIVDAVKKKGGLMNNTVSPLRQKIKEVSKLLSPVIKETLCIIFGHNWVDVCDNNKDEVSPSCFTKNVVVCKRCGKVYRFKSKI